MISCSTAYLPLALPPLEKILILQRAPHLLPQDVAVSNATNEIKQMIADLKRKNYLKLCASLCIFPT